DEPLNVKTFAAKRLPQIVCRKSFAAKIQTRTAPTAGCGFGFLHSNNSRQALLYRLPLLIGIYIQSLTPKLNHSGWACGSR
ncbi:MAG: hypothetical protein QMB24_18100, partial [Spirosomataceae bacterium]